MKFTIATAVLSLAQAVPFYGSLYMEKDSSSKELHIFAVLGDTKTFRIGNEYAFFSSVAFKLKNGATDASVPIKTIQNMVTGADLYHKAGNDFAGMTKIQGDTIPTFPAGKVAVVTIPEEYDFGAVTIDFSDNSRTYIEASDENMSEVMLLPLCPVMADMGSCITITHEPFPPPPVPPPPTPPPPTPPSPTPPPPTPPPPTPPPPEEEPEPSTPVFINELHYDNKGTDLKEGVEIAGPFNTKFKKWTINFYDGSGEDAVLYHTYAFQNWEKIPSQTTDPVTGQQFGTYWVEYDGPGHMHNGPRGAVELKDKKGETVQFISYEGDVEVDGEVADPMVDKDGKRVSENRKTRKGHAMQLLGYGRVYEDFTWSSQPFQASRGNPNIGQFFQDPATFPRSPPSTPPLSPPPPLLPIEKIPLFINEIHYQNRGEDKFEGIEIAGPAGTKVHKLVFEMYSESTGSVKPYKELTVWNKTGVIPDQSGTGFGTYWVKIEDMATHPAAIGFFSKNKKNLLQFISYGAVVTAAEEGDVPEGTESDLMTTASGKAVTEGANLNKKKNLQLEGVGQYYHQFHWKKKSATHSRGRINSGQTLAAV